MTTSGKIILQGVTGSRAYGMDTPESDTDMKAVYVAPTIELVSLFPPKDTYDYHDPDFVVHELGKFAKLALACNPTILEMLYLEDYEVLTPEGQCLVDKRKYFLSRRVADSYGGYAISQVHRLQKRGGESFSSDTRHRYAKHARHCFRLLLQGRQLLETGSLSVRVSPAVRDMLFRIGEMSPEDLARRFEDEYSEFKVVALESELPEKADVGEINRVLTAIRRLHA